jgi:type II secretory pathway component PulF
MRNSKSFLVMEKKPTSSGAGKNIVGGEIYPANLLELTLANVFWILLLLIPIALVYVFARRGQRLPSPVRALLRLIPAAARVFI